MIRKMDHIGKMTSQRSYNESKVNQKRAREPFSSS
jgi:hypothetical protein